MTHDPAVTWIIDQWVAEHQYLSDNAYTTATQLLFKNDSLNHARDGVLTNKGAAYPPKLPKRDFNFGLKGSRLFRHPTG